MRPILESVSRHKKYLFIALFLATIHQIFSLIDPQIFRLLIDNYITSYQDLERDEFIRGVILLILAGMLAAFVSRTARTFQDYYVSLVTQKSGADLYEKGVKHTFSLPFVVFEDRQSGEILQKLQKARQDLEGLIDGFVSIVFFSLVGIIFVLIYAFTVHWLIGLLYFLLIPILGVTATVISKAVKKAQSDIVKQASILAGSTTETLRNVELVKSLGLEEQEITRLNKSNEVLLGFELAKVKILKRLNFIQGTLINAMRSLLMLVMVILIFNGSITTGEFFSLLLYSFFIFNPLGQIGQVATRYQEAKASSEKLEEILSLKSEPKPSSAVKIEEIVSVEFKDVSFAYEKDDALTNASFIVKNGETMGLAGSSGSGKSTIIKLLVGLYKPQKGNILINGVDSQKVDFDYLRSKIGFVAQETQLFAGTIRDNLKFVNESADDKMCLDVLKSAGVSHIVERSSLGLSARIGEGGIKLSGGEKQRLAIARALLRNPEILILDEATSSLDSTTEKKIITTIKKIRKERPKLIIIQVAHRLATLFESDQIQVLEHGLVIERGTHKELVSKKGLYFAFWRQQQGSI